VNRFYLFFSWILSYLRFADKNDLRTMNKQQCRQLLADSLNVELDEEIFEKLFQVKSNHSFGFLLFSAICRMQIKMVKEF
jgi:hypothetical protein